MRHPRPYRYPGQQGQQTGPTYSFGRSPQANQSTAVANAVDRARASQTGDPGKPMTLPHDFSGFDKTFTPSEPEAVEARHPNVASVRNPPPTDAQRKEPDVNSAAVQGALNAVNQPGKSAAELTAQARLPGNQTSTTAGGKTTPAGVETPFGQIAVRNVPRGTPEPTAAQTAQDTTSVGVAHPATPRDWQQRVMKNHPEIGVAGSDANKAFVSAYQDAQKKGGDFDPIALAKTTTDTVETERSKTAQAAQEKTAGDVMGQAEQAAAADKANAAKTAANKQAVTDAATENARTFTSNTPLGKAEDIANAVPSIPGKVADAAGTAGRAISDAVGIKPSQGPSTPALPPLNISPGTGREAANLLTKGNHQNDSPEQTAANVKSANDILGPSTPAPQVADTAQPPIPNEAKGRVPYRFPNMATGLNNPYQVTSAELSGHGMQAQNNTGFVGASSSPTQFTSPGTQPRDLTDLANDDRAAQKAMGDINPPRVTVRGGAVTQTNPNYAKGRMPFQFGKPMANAMQREKTAIAHHVGGAQRGDKPEPVNLPGVGPSVINTGEQVVPNAAGGAAVLTRKMQRKPFRFSPR